MDKIIDYLKQLELSDSEAKLYLALLKSGTTGVKELAKAIGIKRTTAYIYIDLLVEKGLVIKTVKGSRNQVAAIRHTESLLHLVEKKFKSAKTVKENLPEVLAALENTLPQVNDFEDTEIQYYKSVNGIKKIYRDALSGQELRLYATLSELLPLFPDDPDLFENALKHNKKLKIFEIYGDSPTEIQQFDYTAKNKRYLYKFMPSHVGLTAPGILLYDNKVAIINTKGNPSGVVLHNTDYYINSKKLFDFIWQLLPEIHTNV